MKKKQLEISILGKLFPKTNIENWKIFQKQILRIGKFSIFQYWVLEIILKLLFFSQLHSAK